MKQRNVILFVLSTILLSISLVQARGANGGTDCAACVLIMGLTEQLAQVHSTDIISAANMLCSYLPPTLDKACHIIIGRFGPSIIDALYYNETPDLICHSIGICTQDTGKEFCHLFPLPSNFKAVYKRATHSALLARKLIPEFVNSQEKRFDICSIPGVQEICTHVNDFSKDHLPLQDADGDKYSSEVNTFRGAMWRGRDCNDKRVDFYPGRISYNLDESEDSNCNGIYGVDPNSGMPFEQLYCGSESTPRGIVLLGDSAGAHFHIPPEYLMAETLNEHTFKDLLMILENEFDWPMLSSASAYNATNSWPNSIDGPIDSVYLRMRSRNLCNHRDFQNIGVNGARSSSMRDIVKSMARNQNMDYPVIAILALLGNDVCNGHADTIADMTSPKEFRANTMDTLHYLDTVLPKGSTVFLSGLADGRVLWDTLWNRIHPIGELNKDVTYQALYDFLNCLEISPCSGWMNSNETLRNFTSERAANLSKQAEDIANKETFNNFDVYYVDYDIRYILTTWEEMGGQAWEVIEPVDGFHPGQIGQALSTSHLWDLIEKNHPTVLGKVNQYNNKIKTTFGEQGGY